MPVWPLITCAGSKDKWLSYGRETARRTVQYSNLMTGGVGLYCDVLVSVGFTCCQVTQDCRQYLIYG